MRLRVASVGQRMPGWVTEAWDTYARRMPRELPLELIEIPLVKRGNNADLARHRRTEGKALYDAAGAGAHVVALDGRGKSWSTEQLAQRLEHWMGQGKHCAFLIGGPDGLDEPSLSQAAECWSLGPLTLPHPLVRVLLAEQLYRAWTITRNHPYHRA
ncbi:MAG: 23S rRNA (pseudouridine(1915)-N(3))-methyltransferase RlmH [Xanthomonadales bacterium]|nr:23S rRNA (pseudouridine(1915)-N(3))-methyltransferase RlmH [Xanthomonadales bacterium]